jgi:hypothetical protein
MAVRARDINPDIEAVQLIKRYEADSREFFSRKNTTL